MSPPEANAGERVTDGIRRGLRLVSLAVVTLFGACVIMLVSAVMGTATVAATTRTDVPKYGISFNLPEDWTQVSLSPGDVGGLLGNASNVDPSVKSFLTTQATAVAKKGLKFFAVNPGGGANVNIGIYSGAESLSGLDASAKLGLSASGAKKVQTKVVHFKFGTAVEATYTLSVSDALTPIYGTQFYASHKKKMYITTFSSPDGVEVKAAASAMMPTWVFSS